MMLGFGEAFSFGEKIIDKIWPDAESADKAKLELMKLGQSGELEKFAATANIMLAEANSTDKWTSRARPSFMYVMYTLFMLCMVGAIIGVWHPQEMKQAADNLALLFNAIPDILYQVFFGCFTVYAGGRTFEKIKGVSK